MPKGSNVVMPATRKMSGGLASPPQIQTKRKSQDRSGPTATKEKGALKSLRRGSVHFVVDKAQETLEKMALEHSRTINPDSYFSSSWDIMIAVFLAITTLVGPLEVAFISPLSSDLSPFDNMDGIFWMNRVIDMGFAIDFYRQFRLAYTDPETSQWVTQPKLVAMHYAKGWMVVDFISTVPWDLLDAALSKVNGRGEGGGTGLKLLRLIKLLKLAKLLRLRKFLTLFERVSQRLGLAYNVKSLVKYFTIFFVIAHMVACGWRIISDLVDIYNDPVVSRLMAENKTIPAYAIGWVARQQSSKMYQHSLTDADVYSLCIEYALSTFSMGYGTVSPVSSIERNYSIFCLVFAGCFYAYMIGAVCMSISEDEGEALYKRNMDTLTKMCRNEDVEEDLRHRLMDFYRFQHNLISNSTCEEVLGTVTNDLRGEMKEHMHGQWIKQVHCFNIESENTGTEFRRAVCEKLVMVAIPPLATLYRVGDIADSMMVLTKGLLQRIGSREGFQGAGINHGSVSAGAIEFRKPKMYYTSWNMIGIGEWIGKEILMQHRGSHFEEEGSQSIKRPDTVAVLSYSFLQKLDAHSLWDVIKARPAFFASISVQIRRSSLGMRLENKMRHIGRLTIELKDRTGSPRLTKRECARLKHEFSENRDEKNSKSASKSPQAVESEEHKRARLTGQRDISVTGSELLDVLAEETGFTKICDQLVLNDNCTESYIRGMIWKTDDRPNKKNTGAISGPSASLVNIEQ